MENMDGRDLLIREIKMELNEANQKNDILQSELDEMKKGQQYIQYCLDETRNSFSYKLGFALTTVPRAIRKLIKNSKGGNS